MSRETENVLLLLIGVATAMISFAGNYTCYVKPQLLPWLLAGAAVLIGLSLTCIVRDIRRGGPPHLHGHDTHNHQHRAGIAWLLLVPIAVLIFVVPPALDARAAAPSPVAVSTDVLHHPYPPLPPGPAPVVRLTDMLRRVANDSAGTLNGRTITIRAFTIKDNNRTDVARIVIICCAADAQLARIHLEGPAAATVAGYPENTWVQVQGQVAPAPREHSGRFIPTLVVSNVQRIARPANTYDY